MLPRQYTEYILVANTKTFHSRVDRFHMVFKQGYIFIMQNTMVGGGFDGHRGKNFKIKIQGGINEKGKGKSSKIA